jgi:hypothetical protein
VCVRRLTKKQETIGEGYIKGAAHTHWDSFTFCDFANSSRTSIWFGKRERITRQESCTWMIGNNSSTCWKEIDEQRWQRRNSIGLFSLLCCLFIQLCVANFLWLSHDETIVIYEFVVELSCYQCYSVFIQNYLCSLLFIWLFVWLLTLASCNHINWS